MRELDTNNHSVFLLTYHLVLVVKDRQKVITTDIAARVRELGETIGSGYHITFLEYNHDQDYIHILFKSHPKSPLAKYINAFKSASSRLIKKEFPEVRRQLWKEYFWSQSYCLLTTGGDPLEILKRYIETQGERRLKQLQII